jgi:hypothetical protein
MFNYDDDGDMRVMGAGARGVDENQRKTRERNKQREKDMSGQIQSSRINPYQSPFIKTNSSYIIIHHRCSTSVITHQHSSLIIYNIYIIDIIIGKFINNPHQKP